MNDLKKCPICNSTNVEPGRILSTGKLHFRPEHAKFLKLKTANTEVNAHLCLDCGHISLMGDAEKVKGLTGKVTMLEPLASPQNPVGVH
jgi:predicted nucleic-acid-binding Zn-ribbon protein